MKADLIRNGADEGNRMKKFIYFFVIVQSSWSKLCVCKMRPDGQKTMPEERICAIRLKAKGHVTCTHIKSNIVQTHSLTYSPNPAQLKAIIHIAGLIVLSIDCLSRYYYYY